MKFRSQTKKNYRVEDEDNGDIYELREMSAAARDAYLQQHSDRLRTGPDGKPSGIKKFDGYQAALLSRCMFKLETKEGPVNPPTLVADKEVQAWPASQCQILHEKAQEINGLVLKTEEEEPEKNG